MWKICELKLKIGFMLQNLKCLNHLPLNWARKLFVAFSKMDDKLEIEELQASIINLETCNRCSRIGQGGCDVMEYCEN